VPLDVIKAKRAPYRQHGKPWHRPALQNLDDYDIIQAYGAEYRGIVGYYMLAIDVWRFNELEWYAKTSMLKTLAAKHQSSVSKMAAKYAAKIETPHGLRTCYEARIQRGSKPDLVARFGGIPLVRNMDAVLSDRVPDRPPTPRHPAGVTARSGSRSSDPDRTHYPAAAGVMELEPEYAVEAAVDVIHKRCGQVSDGGLQVGLVEGHQGGDVDY
jgi:hypothetical protein